MSFNPYDSPETAGESPRSTGLLKRRLLQLLAVVGVISLVIALLLPVSRGGREASRRSSCSNNLKQIGLALQLYHDVHHAFPPAYTVDAAGKPLHSWRTLILPYLEQQALYDTIDLTKPWDHPVNKAALETTIHTYHCPSATSEANHTAYLAAVGPHSCFHPTEPRTLAEITDDHNSTLMIIEFDAKQAVPWMSPLDATEDMILHFGEATTLPHLGGAQAAFVSGQAFYMSAEVKAETLRALISISGNDDALTEDAK